MSVLCVVSLPFLMIGLALLWRHMQPAKTRFQSVSRLYQEGGLAALDKSFEVTGVRVIEGVIDATVYDYDDSRLNATIVEQNTGKVYCASIFADAPFSDSATALIDSDENIGRHATFTLVGIKRDSRRRAVQPYAVIDVR